MRYRNNNYYQLGGYNNIFSRYVRPTPMYYNIRSYIPMYQSGGSVPYITDHTGQQIPIGARFDDFEGGVYRGPSNPTQIDSFEDRPYESYADQQAKLKTKKPVIIPKKVVSKPVTKTNVVKQPRSGLNKKQVDAQYYLMKQGVDDIPWNNVEQISQMIREVDGSSDNYNYEPSPIYRKTTSNYSNTQKNTDDVDKTGINIKDLEKKYGFDKDYVNSQLIGYDISNMPMEERFKIVSNRENKIKNQYSRGLSITDGSGVEEGEKYYRQNPITFIQPIANDQSGNSSSNTYDEINPNYRMSIRDAEMFLDGKGVYHQDRTPQEKLKIADYYYQQDQRNADFDESRFFQNQHEGFNLYRQGYGGNNRQDVNTNYRKNTDAQKHLSDSELKNKSNNEKLIYYSTFLDEHLGGIFMNNKGQAVNNKGVVFSVDNLHKIYRKLYPNKASK